MPSPTFGARGVLIDAVAMAVREAWEANGDKRVAYKRLAATLRRTLGNEGLAQRALPAAVHLFKLQSRPAGDIEAPHIAVLSLCPHCRRLKLIEERQPYRNKVRMEVLRDVEWMRRQFEDLHHTDEDIARDLNCCKQSVAMWRNRHGIEPPNRNRAFMDERVLRELLVDKKLAPGEVAAELGCEVCTVRNWAKELGVVPNCRDFAHCTFEWWNDRVQAGWSQYRMATAAGIVKHAVQHHLKKWGLYKWVGCRARKPNYPQLYVPGWLRRELARKGATFVKIARKVGCSETSVTYAAKKLCLIDQRRPPGPSPWTKDPEWYRERFKQKMTAEQMAEEAGVKVKSIQNYLSELGLLREYWQEVERWGDKSFASTRKMVLAGTLK